MPPSTDHKSCASVRSCTNTPSINSIKKQKQKIRERSHQSKQAVDAVRVFVSTANDENKAPLLYRNAPNTPALKHQKNKRFPLTPP